VRQVKIPGDLLVVRNDRLGDAVLALPAVSLLRNAYPDRRIYFWASPQVAPLIRCVEGIDHVIEGNDRGEPDVTRELSSLEIQAAFCLRSSFRNALTLWRAHIPLRIGTSRRLYSPLFTTRLNIPRRRTDRHEADLNLDMLSALGIRGEARFPAVIPPVSAAERIGRLFSEAGRSVEQPYVVIHPGSGGSSQNWNAGCYRQLAEKLAGSRSFNIVVTGSQDEFDTCRTVAGDDHLNFCGKTDLPELAALLMKAGLLVTNSTGPLHLGVAAGVTSVGIYPPLADCLPGRWGPYHHPDWAIMPDLPVCRRCSPGEISACRCLEQLTPDMVYEHLLKLIGER